MCKQTREEILHAFNAELVYIRTTFPQGKTGLKLRNGSLAPNGAELQQLLALWGPAVKPGDRARISDIVIKDDHIRFEINGGPIKRQKWYQHIQIEGTATVTPGNSSPDSGSNANAHGSFVDLYFDRYVPEMTGPELKQFLRPVFDFDAKSPVEAYLETVPPKVKEAISHHQVLVGMNHEMVIYSKGRPPKRLREHDGDIEYEEWIYGTPPQDVDFVRFVGEEVVRVETMKVDGQKTVRVEKEIDLGESTVAKKQPSERPVNAPTLRRPGEEMPDTNPANPSGTPPMGAPPPPLGSPAPGSDPGPQWLPSASLAPPRVFSLPCNHGRGEPLHRLEDGLESLQFGIGGGRALPGHGDRKDIRFSLARIQVGNIFVELTREKGALGKRLIFGVSDFEVTEMY